MPAEPAATPAQPVRSVDRALRVLEILARDGESSLGAMARELGVHKTTVSRLVEVLIGHDLVDPPEEPGRYRLGVGCLRLAGATAARLDLTTEAQPICDALATELDDTCNVAILSDGFAVNVCQAQGSTVVAMRNWIGQRTPLHATATGKVLLSHLPAQDAGEPLPAQLDELTEHTITDRKRLHAQLDEVRRQGWAYALEEYEEGLHAVAAPVRDHTGEVVAALSAAGPAYRLSAEALPEARDAVVSASRRLSRRLGYAAR